MSMPKLDQIYTYKEKRYIITHPISDTDLIQHNGKWEPCVKYANYPPDGKRFNRALSEFCDKFELVV